MRSFLLVVVPAAACSAFGGGADDTGEGDGGASGTLPDLTAGLDTEGCEDVDGTAIPGAVSFFVGEYERGDGSWSGAERWLLFANDAWKAAGEDDCVVRWTTTASEAAPTTCATCDLALAVGATIDESATTCPDGLWDSPTERNWTATYEIRIEGDQSTWYYDSGTSLGEGAAVDGAVNFVTEKDCVWF